MFRSSQKNDSLFYLGLVFLLFPLLGVVYFHYPVWTLALTILFAIVYLLLIHLKDSFAKGLALLWFYLIGYIVWMSLMISGSMMWFFFFPSNLLIWRFADGLKSYRMQSFLIAMLLTTGLEIFGTTDVATKVSALVVMVIILVMTYYQYRLQVESAMKREIERQDKYIGTLMAENERNRIGRDLHDTLGHTFALMTIKTELALKQLEKKDLDRVKSELAELHQVSTTAMTEVRALINQLKYRSLDDEIDHLTQMLDLSGIAVQVDNNLTDESLHPRVQSQLVMILRELVTNVIKHSQATSCDISLTKTEQIVLLFKDNGKGFKNLSGDELQSIKERLQQIDGQLTITSLRKPTIITVVLEDKGL